MYTEHTQTHKHTYIEIDKYENTNILLYGTISQ